MYIVVEIQTNADSTVGNLVFAYADKNEAYSKYHSILAAAAVSILPKHAAVILQNDGLPLEFRCFEHGGEAE